MTVNEPTELTGYCYTKAKRIPLMIGRLPGMSGQLWGGPYTVTQVVVAVVSFALLWQVRGLWSPLGSPWNGLVVLGIPLSLAWLVRRARVEGRDPLRALAAIGSFYAAPRSGRLDGRAPQAPRSVVVRPCRFTTTETTLARPGGQGRTAVQQLLDRARQVRPCEPSEEDR